MRILAVFAFLIYLGVGLVQVFATIDGLEQWIGLPGFLAVIAAFVLAYFPIVGSIIGFVGAIDIWGWEWWQAALLFFGSFLLFAIMGAGAILIDVRERRKNRQP